VVSREKGEKTIPTKKNSKDSASWHEDKTDVIRLQCSHRRPVMRGGGLFLVPEQQSTRLHRILLNRERGKGKNRKKGKEKQKSFYSPYFVGKWFGMPGDKTA